MPIIFIVQLVSISLFIILSAIEARLFMPGHYFDNHLRITDYWAIYPSVSGSRKRTKVEPIDPYDKQCINANLVYHAIFYATRLHSASRIFSSFASFRYI